jgi:hypothetical protein
MRMKSLKTFTAVLLLMLANHVVSAQSLYSNTVMSLNPVAYWPLQENTPPPRYDIETNYGSLGSIANAYYASTNAWHAQVGATGDSDAAVKFTAAGGSFAIVPTTDPRVSLTAGQPFTVELWTLPTSQTMFRGIISQTGGNNSGGLNAANANSQGWALSMGFAAYRGTGGNNSSFGFDFHVYNGNGFTGGADADCANTNCWLTGGPIDYTNSWVYLACVFDGTNAWVYMYSTNLVSSLSGTNMMQFYPQLPITTAAGAPLGGPGTQIAGLTFLPDTWDPIQIASERGGGANLYPGYMDEIAIYTNALTQQQITNHFAAGTNGLGNYAATISADQPVMYWRMDAPLWTPPSPASYPAAMNYGSAASGMTNANTGGSGASSGVYQPGTVPGKPGPTYRGFGTLSNACAFNGLVGAVDAGFHPLLNPTSPTNNFTMVGWFRGNPMDTGARNNPEAIVSHSAKSWNVSVKNGATTGSKGAGGTPTIALNTINANDGNWHMLALESAYVAGVSTNLTVSLDSGAFSAFVANPSAIPGTNLDVWIGGAPDLAEPTNEATYLGAQQYLAGEVCHVAYFTNALTASQLVALYSAARPEPLIGRQPVSGLAGVGGTYTNSVGASGQPVLYYHWFKDNVLLSTQTNANLVLNPVQPSDQSTNYFVTVSNSFGSVTSAVVTLTVVSNLTFVQQFPMTYTNTMTLYGGQNVGGTNYLGSTPTFSVSAVGAVPISYQWYTNGVAKTGATGASLTVTNCQMTSPTSFYCVASNSYGTLTSTVWGVSYVPAPMAPFPQMVLAAGPVAYWRLNERDDQAFDGNPGAVCNDYQTGNNGIYTNVYLQNVTFGTGYSPATDPNETAGEFGVFPTTSAINCDANSISNVDFSVPAGGDGEFTVAVWANGNSFGQPGNAGLVTKGFFNGEEFTLDEGSSINPQGLRFYVRDALATGYDASSSIKLGNDSNWHFVVGVCDGANGGTSLYVDGVRVGGAVLPAGAGIINSASVPVMIGARAGSPTSGGNNQFRGLLNDVAVYNYALSLAQITAQYQGAGGTVAPYFLPPLPSTNLSAGPGAMLTIPVTAVGTPSIGYFWTNLTTSSLLASGTTNGETLNATLVYSSSVPTTNQLELIVTNAYGVASNFFTLSITNPVNTNPTNITFSVASGNQLMLSWPADHTGWRLQSQTNAPGVGLTRNWFDVRGSANVNQITVPISTTNGSVFYRLVYP